MPNHVTNKIEFSGKQENIDKVLELIKGEEVIDFNKIIPMPITLNLVSGGDDDASIQYAISKMDDAEAMRTQAALMLKPVSFYKSYYNKVFGMRKFTEDELEERAKEFEKQLKVKPKFDNVDYDALGIKSFEDLGKMYINNIMKYGHDSWYEWRCEHWGTKWGAYDVYDDGNEITFDTAWSCPLPILSELAKICIAHNVTFEGKWADEYSGYNVGVFGIDDEGFYYQRAENKSNEAYEIYIELKGECNCIGMDEDGNYIHYDCDNCPNGC